VRLPLPEWFRVLVRRLHPAVLVKQAPVLVDVVVGDDHLEVAGAKLLPRPEQVARTPADCAEDLLDLASLMAVAQDLAVVAERYGQARIVVVVRRAAGLRARFARPPNVPQEREEGFIPLAVGDRDHLRPSSASRRTSGAPRESRAARPSASRSSTA